MKIKKQRKGKLKILLDLSLGLVFPEMLTLMSLAMAQPLLILAFRIFYKEAMTAIYMNLLTMNSLLTTILKSLN